MAIASVLVDKKRVDFNAVASGATVGTDYAIPANHTLYVRATAVGKYNAGGFGASVSAVFERGAGASSLTSAAGAGPNPETNLDAGAWASAASFSTGTPTASKLVASASGNNAHFAITNNGAGANDFVLLIDVIDIG